MANMQRQWMESPYHYCSRCWRRIPLSELTWQNGMLLCKWDWDSMIIGEREAMIMRVLTTGPQDEMRPDRKLTEPNSGNLIDEIVLT